MRGERIDKETGGRGDGPWSVQQQFRTDWHDRNRFLYETLRNVATILIKLGAIQLRVRGVKNLPETGPVLLMANHQSNLDPALIAWAIRRPMSIPAKKQLFGIPVFGHALLRLGAFPVDRESADPGSLRRTLGLLRDGRVVCVFPEKTRSVTGNMGSFQPTLTKLVVRERVPVIPIGISGTGEMLGKGHIVPKFGSDVTLTFGEPADLEEFYGGKLSDARLADATERLRARIDRLR